MTKTSNFKPKISLIAIVAKDRGIGKDNKLLFDIPDDLKHFQGITKGHSVIMGYNTYKSIGKALPERRNIVLCNQMTHLHDAKTCRSIEAAIELCQDEDEIFFIGGASVYEQAIKMADKLYLTLVDAVVPADTFFPDYSDFDKVEVTGEGEKDDLKFKYLELTK